MKPSSSNAAMMKAGVLLDLPFSNGYNAKDVKAPPDLLNSSSMVSSGIQSLLKNPLPVLLWIRKWIFASGSHPIK